MCSGNGLQTLEILRSFALPYAEAGGSGSGHGIYIVCCDRPFYNHMPRCAATRNGGRSFCRWAARTVRLTLRTVREPVFAQNTPSNWIVSTGRPSSDAKCRWGLQVPFLLDAAVYPLQTSGIFGRHSAFFHLFSALGPAASSAVEARLGGSGNGNELVAEWRTGPTGRLDRRGVSASRATDGCFCAGPVAGCLISSFISAWVQCAIVTPRTLNEQTVPISIKGPKRPVPLCVGF